MCSGEEFATIKEIRHLVEKMVEMKNNIVYPLVFIGYIVIDSASCDSYS